MKYQVFTDNGACVIEADGYEARSGYTGFYRIVGSGQSTTFPEWWQRLLGKRRERKPVQVTEFDDWILTSAIWRLHIVRAASGTEARQRPDPEEGLDPKGDGPTLEERDAQTPIPSSRERK